MSHVAWTAALFRILAVWLACEVLINVPATIAAVFGISRVEPPTSMSELIGPPIVMWVATAFVIAGVWKGSSRLANLVWRDLPAPTRQSRIEPAAVQQAVFAGLGIYLVVTALPELSKLALSYFNLPGGFDLEMRYAGELWGAAVGGVIQIAAGVTLVIMARQAGAWLTREPRTNDDDLLTDD